ncbi:MAG: hypothetical protein FVQ80_00635 [Planctomycetes bacterium]|nr:hypothetical protein [Planctomycetota bacterium]
MVKSGKSKPCYDIRCFCCYRYEAYNNKVDGMLGSIINRKPKPKLEKLHSPNVHDRPGSVAYQKQIEKDIEKDIEKQTALLGQPKKRITTIQVILILADMLLVNLGFLCSFWIRYGWPFPKESFAPYAQSFIFLTMINILILLSFKAYKNSFRSSWDMFLKISKGLLGATLLSIVFIYVFRISWSAFPTSIFGISFLVNLLLVFKFNQWLLKKNKRIKKKIVVVGRGDIDISEIITKKAYIEQYQINHFSELLKYKDAHEIIICDKIQDKKDMEILVYVSQRFGINVTFSPSCYMSLLSDKFNGNDSFGLIKTFIGKQTDFEEFLMLSLDIVGSVTFLIAYLPVIILTSILIKISSPGPIIYKQRRAGKDGKTFTLYKFRTMVENAEKLSGFKPVVSGDSRITKLGLFLRQTRTDEIPQLLNVLKGDMSLVGPRPENLYRIDTHKALQGIRLAVRPGLTGLAQIRSYYDLAPNHKIKYDYLYIQKRSLLLNIYILLRTIPVILSKKGS